MLLFVLMLVLAARYGEEGGRLCFGGSGGLVWWDNLQKIRTGAGLVNEGWLIDNIAREVGNGREIYFGEIHGLMGFC